METALAIALKKVPGGEIKSAELEREHGKLIYSFDIKTARGITEVNVSAISGKVIASIARPRQRKLRRCRTQSRTSNRAALPPRIAARSASEMSSAAMLSNIFGRLPI
jgi:ribosomal protein L34E